MIRGNISVVNAKLTLRSYTCTVYFMSLRIVMGGLKDDIHLSADPLRNGGRTSIGVTTWGAGETLTRVTAQGKVVPWLAEAVCNIDPLTWHVTLRPNARFWDGTPVTPQAVATAFAESCVRQTDVHVLIDQETVTRVVDESTLEFRTPRPYGHFPNALAHPQMIVFGPDGAPLTGPYRPVEFETDRRLVLAPFVDHWAGPPPLARIDVAVHPDLDTQIHALESGEADLIYAFPPEHVDRLSSFDDTYQVTSTATMRLLSIQINTTRHPFDDRDVREATSLAIDREALLAGTLRGHGLPATSMVPPWAGDASPLQSTNVTRARQLLDAGGWTMGADGVRHKGDRRLAFTMYTPGGEVLALAALARAIKHQLAPLGYDITIESVAALSAAVKDGAYSAAIRTSYAHLTGDPYFWLSLWFASGGRVNPGPSYLNPEFDRALEQYRREIAPDQRRARWRAIESILAHDVPHIYLVWAPLIIVGRPGTTSGFVADPNNEYFISNALSN
jgi:peptide/nickel transport system substrate-binding protein